MQFIIFCFIDMYLSFATEIILFTLIWTECFIFIKKSYFLPQSHIPLPGEAMQYLLD